MSTLSHSPLLRMIRCVHLPFTAIINQALITRGLLALSLVSSATPLCVWADVAETTTDRVIVPVDSEAFVFSPGNWTGDDDRSGHVFRQTWNPGAYFRVTWESSAAVSEASILLDTSTYTKDTGVPRISYSIDGRWTLNQACTEEIQIKNLKGAGRHELCVYLSGSQQQDRWGEPGKSGLNVLRVLGVQLDAQSRPIANSSDARWALIVGDSITEGIGASPLLSYSYLVGQALRRIGWEYGVSACGWSGWLNKGDQPPGDVPGYYVISGSKDGVGGSYHDELSRWNKIDGNNHSLLDSQGRISGHGELNQEPSLILINYGPNDTLHRSDPSDTRASIVQALAALRRSAPEAHIVLIIPFGQYYADALQQSVVLHQQDHPADDKIAIIDLGVEAKNAIYSDNSPYGGLHPNDRGCANFAAQIIAELVTLLNQ
ncbi:SGNH/GDSL hydrolase family protein [Coraliomargarita algicola]|uniref:SGNH/GDSL hydrolase family protein n=1 Tax=Coraliomargarita algicola TaxID=3092156 RepID=A0ABZ0RQL8_9BACT|nr:SGNH/GDSL hydrolase family protein [Coraliomargarita sp. J2-16]WPJ97192.1 SGNH/GDSL hydrolase family protein [Coraliomargarita sp. J2-16]